MERLIPLPGHKSETMNSESVITSMQQWLLAQGKCVSCGKDLGDVDRIPDNGHFLITCKCRKVFVWEPTTRIYRLAYLEDVR